MSLLDLFSDEYTVLNQTNSDDGYGSYKVEYTEGETFRGSIAFNESHVPSSIESLDLKSTYKLLFPKEVTLSFHQVIKRADGKIFRVTSDGSNVFTPNSSQLNLRLVELEDWSLEDDDHEGISQS